MKHPAARAALVLREQNKMDGNHFWQRSEQIADNIRSYLVTVHTAGIGTIFALIAAKDFLTLKWAFAPFSFFCIGLIITGLNLFAGKDKALKRFHDETQRPKETDARSLDCCFWRRQEFWDFLSFWLFITGIASGFFTLIDHE
jgi:hypothetical protein